jgi:formylglycine-generating enzyme
LPRPARKPWTEGAGLPHVEGSVNQARPGFAPRSLMPMRDRLLLLAVLAAAAALAALLVFPRERRALPPEEAAPSASAPPTEAPSPRASASADAGSPATLPAYVHIDPMSPTVCGDGMILVDGVYCPYVGHTCKSFLNEERDVCQSYAPDVLCEGRLQHRRFCIDVFEYPNLPGVVPVVMTDWLAARRACAVEGKRLCTVEEWEFACEGTEMWPYPYGTERDAEACNIDRPAPLPELGAFSDPWKISEEVERLDQRAPSGAFPRCVSPFGVRDMTGNVDEWVENTNGTASEKPYRSTLKGGYWGPARARCRPVTSTHNEWFSFYQVGFRCCRDAKGSERPVSAAPPAARIPRRQRMATPSGRPTP